METTGIMGLYRGYIGIIGYMYWGYVWIMENKMEATIVSWDYMGIREKQMETTVMRYMSHCLNSKYTP